MAFISSLITKFQIIFQLLLSDLSDPSHRQLLHDALEALAPIVASEPIAETLVQAAESATQVPAQVTVTEAQAPKS